MEQQPPLQKPRRKSPWILGGFVLLLLTVLVLLQSSNLWKNFSIDSASDTLVLYALSSLNFIAFVIFGFIFLRSIIKLVRERRALQLGSRIKTRLFLYFAAISLLPIIAMAGFSYLFMNRALERWFTQIPENVVREARTMQSQALQDQAENLQGTANMLVAVLEKRDFSNAELREIADAGNLTRVEVLSKDNKIIDQTEKRLSAAQKADLGRAVESARSGEINDQSLQSENGFDVAMSSFIDGRKLLIVRNSREEKSASRIVDSSLVEFDRLKDKQITVRQIGFLTLGVLTFLLIFASTWTAFYIARGLTVPIKALAEGAGEIARGNLAHRVNVFAEDEIALLVSAFNEMSGKLEKNSLELIERQKYIETVLQALPTGVISFDSDNRVSTINRAAITILRLEDANFSGLSLAKLVKAENGSILERILVRAKRIGRASEQTTLRHENAAGKTETDADLPVALSATTLPDNNGVVLLIEDLSELISAQRAAAWQEVARRMAHEIKNPLTPIQLSAERIAKRFSDGKTLLSEPPAVAGGLTLGNRGYDVEIRPINSEDQAAKVIKDGTDTILREVRSLKSMVDEFSRFARMPDAKLQSGDLNEIIIHLLTLYEDRLDNVSIKHNLAAELPKTLLDAEQIKRVFVNLIDNAIEAFGDSGDERTITISTRHDVARDILVSEVSDNGKGIDPADFQKLFQPYFSTKGRGTGLGLAIVQRIITEHHGKIKVVGNQPSGAKFIIELLVSE